MAIFRFYKMAAAAILNFQIFEILIVGTVTRAKLRHRPPSWICDAHVWTTHEGHLVVFTIVHNSVGIDAVVSIICKF